MVGSGRGGAARTRRSREASPDRARASSQPRVRPFRKVQIVYYLCRNGQLEQPHFMEVTHIPNHHLRLKDVMERLTVLRGKGMPSLFSWSCKRNYKNGYVWNDLAENDVIHPAEGSEYILKGSEIVEACSERFRQLQLGVRKREPLPGMQPRHLQVEEPEADVEEVEEDDEEAEAEETEEVHISTRCSRGVSTQEMATAHRATGRSHHTEMLLDEDASPPSSSSSEKAHPPASAVSGANHVGSNGDGPGNGGSGRFNDADPAEEPCHQPRGSFLLQLIACGSSAAMKGRCGLPKAAAAAAAVPPPPPASSSSTPNTSGRKSAGSLHKGVLCRAAAATTRAAAVVEEDENVINYMSENPRFGNPLREDKEYFSGSIVESMTESRAATATTGPCLKKSSSYHEERGAKCELGEVFEVEKEAQERSAKAKCMPSRKRATACIGNRQQQSK
uniref:Non-structural protein NS3 n=1 Tax=Anthurium amnicola TaxID=1678845 RepID=A0A1D1Y8F3_9ARAE